MSAPAPGPSWPRTRTANFVTRMQQWDYRLGINGVKRMQAAYNSALVAQGAFSAYWTDDLRAVGGWPDAIGEDIVLTWTMMDSRGIVPVRAGRTRVHRRPRRLGHLLTRGRAGRAECSRGSGTHPPPTQPRVLAKFVAGIDYLVPVLDIGIIFFWVPGVILFVFGYPLIVGWWSMLLLPMTLAIFGFLRRWQERHVFRRLGIHPAARHARLHGIPVRLPGPDLGGIAPRLPAIRSRGRSPLEVDTRPPPGRNAMLRDLPKWRGPESNRRHHGFQPCALPTELPRRAVKRVPA